MNIKNNLPAMSDSRRKGEEIEQLVRDIAELKEAQEALKRSQDGLMALIDSLDSIVWEADAATFRFRFVSPRAERLLGYPVSRWLEEPAFWVTHVHPDDREHAMDYCVRCTREKRDHEFEYRMLAADGRVVWLRDIVTVVVENDAPVKLRGIMVDITAQKEAEFERQRALEQLQASEERFRELAETIEDVFWVSDTAKTRILYISPGYEQIWGRSCESLYHEPRSWLKAVHPEDCERVLHAVTMRQAHGTYDEEYRILRPDGQVRWVRDQAFPVRNAAGQVERVVGVARDVTERKALEQQVRQSQKMEAIGQLAGGIAHDFNNILAALLGNTELALADVGTDHSASESLREIRKAALRGKGLVQQILAFSRQQPQERRVIALGPLVEEAVALLRATIPATVELDVSVELDVPRVLADPTQIHQVLVNLCTNAWHALEERSGRIEVKLQSVVLERSNVAQPEGLQPGPFVRLSVSDNGVGMDALTSSRAFEPFFTTKEPGKGTGLGLSVVHGIVHGHDGTVTVTSHPGHGTIFEVYLPAAAPSDPATAPAATETVRRGAGERILYLDDEEALVFLAARMLERLGYRVAGFTRAADALAAFRADPDDYDLVITDLSMPGISGLRVAEEFLKLRPAMPVVLTSGHVTEELRQEAKTTGVRDVLYKPNTVKEFSEAIHQLASESRQRAR